MFKKNSPRRPTPRHFKEPSQELAEKSAQKSAQELTEKSNQELAEKSNQELTEKSNQELTEKSVQKIPANCKSGVLEDKNTLISELEESLKNLQEAIRQSERVVSNVAAAFSGDTDG